MLPLMTLPSPDKHYFCRKCQTLSAQALSAPSSSPTRVIRLYILVKTNKEPTVMRTKPLHVIVGTPPTDIPWGISQALPAGP